MNPKTSKELADELFESMLSNDPQKRKLVEYFLQALESHTLAEEVVKRLGITEPTMKKKVVEFYTTRFLAKINENPKA